MDAKVVETLRPWFPELDFESVRLVQGGPASWLVRNVLKAGATTVAPYVVFGRHDFDPESPRSLSLLAHELKHVEQYRRMGHVRFLLTYLKDRLRAGHYGRDLPLEQEPYALQDTVRAALQPPQV